MFVNTMGLIVHSFGTISFLIVRIMEPYWFLMALVVVSRQIALLDHAQRAREALTRQGAATLSSSVAGLSGVQLKPMTWSEPGTSFTV
jgi:hypothetical protein